MSDHAFGHLCRRKSIQISGHSDFLGIFSNFEASSILFFLSARRHCGSCVSTTFAAVIRDADELCSANTAQAPGVVFHSVTSEYNSAFVFLNFWFQLRILEMTGVHERRKCTVLPSFLDSAITSFSFLTFVSCHAGIVSSVSHSFSTAACASGIFIA